MKPTVLLASAAAVIAVAGCGKQGERASGPAPADATVTITQAKPPPGGTWADVANATTAGYVLGNPDAPVKLVEIGSLSCPVCKRFEDEGSQSLVNDYVKTGRVSWEFRPYIIHGAADMALNLVARCNGVKSFFPLMKSAYENQTVFSNRLEAAPKDKVAQIQQLPPNQVFIAIANIIGLQDWAAMRGISQAKSNQCLTDQQRIDQEVQFTSDVGTQYPDFKGTPSFILNGNLLSETSSWKALKPQLDEALK